MSEQLGNKPIDRWLGLLATAVGIFLYLLPKTETVIIVCLALMWMFLAHPVINFWWIEKRLWRRIAATLVLTGALIVLGIHIKPEATTTEQRAKPQPASDEASVTRDVIRGWDSSRKGCRTQVDSTELQNCFRLLFVCGVRY